MFKVKENKGNYGHHLNRNDKYQMTKLHDGNDFVCKRDTKMNDCLVDLWGFNSNDIDYTNHEI